jgi:hypothetical protein
METLPSKQELRAKIQEAVDSGFPIKLYAPSVTGKPKKRPYKKKPRIEE